MAVIVEKEKIYSYGMAGINSLSGNNKDEQWIIYVCMNDMGGRNAY